MYVDPNIEVGPKLKPPILRSKKRAVLIAMKDNGLGMASAIATSIPAPYRHT
jgi:hypothetical protein